MKIDIFPHILPIKYKEALYKKMPANFYARRSIDAHPALDDLDIRFRIMDKYEGLVQILTLSFPPIDDVVELKDAVELAKLANDCMAELVEKYPDRFVAAIASLPMNDMDAALREVDRAMTQLRFRGVQIYTDVNGKPLDSPEFLPLYEKMTHYNLPILLHPRRACTVPDYPTEGESKYMVYLLFGWPYETAVAMTRLVFSGVLERYPKLKIITHHCGSMIPYFEQRIPAAYDSLVMTQRNHCKQELTKAPTDYFKMFYNDTAIGGNTSALMCAYAFFGAEHLLFGTDTPYDAELGNKSIRDNIAAIEKMDIPNFEKQLIFGDNAKVLLNLGLPEGC